jgi:DNA-binding CsgD family transcriptional regulator
MPKNSNNDSLIDKILKGEYDIDDTEPTEATVTDDCVYDPGDEDDEADVDPDAYGDEEEDEGYSPDPNDDFPSDEYCEEYMEENGIEAIPEPPAPVGAKYTKFKTDDNTSKEQKPKVNMTKDSNIVESEQPKNAATPAPAANAGTATGKRRGRPSKLIGNEDEVVRLYTEGVSTKTISEKYGCSVSSVINCLRSRNVTIRPKGRRKGS